jgi:uncharacterized membrane protein (Fun14 family)
MSSSRDNNSLVDYLRNTLDDVREMSKLNQVIVGSVAGLATGYVFSKVSKMAAFTIGTGVIGLQIAQHSGYIEIKWGKKSNKLDDIKKKAIKAAEEAGITKQNSKAEKVALQMKSFLQENITFGVSFGGGFLIGFSF